MEKKSHYHSPDGRNYDVTMAWDENFKDADNRPAVPYLLVFQTKK